MIDTRGIWGRMGHRWKLNDGGEQMRVEISDVNSKIVWEAGEYDELKRVIFREKNKFDILTPYQLASLMQLYFLVLLDADSIEQQLGQIHLKESEKLLVFMALGEHNYRQRNEALIRILERIKLKLSSQK